MAACPFGACRCDDLPHGIQLVVAREDHGLFADASLPTLSVVNLLLALLNEHEVAEDVQKAVPLEHVLPKVTGAVATRVLRVSCSALHLARVAPTVEWQEVGPGALQARGHVDLIRIRGEVNHRYPYELKLSCTRNAD